MLNKILMIVAVAASVVMGAKYTIIGNSIADVDAVWDTMTATLGDGSRYVNRAVGGKGWDYFDTLNLVSQPFHSIEYFIAVDTPDVIISDLGINNSSIRIYKYLTPYQTIAYLNKFYSIVRDSGKALIIGEILPVWDDDTTEAVAQAQVDWIKTVNSLYSKWCTYRQVKLAKTFDYFADSLDRPIDSLFNADNVHPNALGSTLLGKRYAAASIPVDTQKVGERTITIKIGDTAVVGSNILYSVDLSKITDSLFWQKALPSGKNIHLYIDGVEKKRIIEDYCPFARIGFLVFQHAITSTIQLKCELDTVSNDSSLYAEANIVRRYACNGTLSMPLIRDVVGGKNATNAAYTAYRYLLPLTVPDINNKKLLISNTKVGKIATPTLNTELGGDSSMTIQFWIYNKTANHVFTTTNALFSWGNATTNCLKVFFANGAAPIIVQQSSGAALSTWSISSDYTAQCADSGWNFYTLIFNGREGTAVNRIKLIRDSTDLTQYATCAGYPQILPTRTDSLLLTGYYTGSYNAAHFGFADIRILDTALTVAEAKQSYLNQVRNYSYSVFKKATGNNKKTNTGLNLAF